MRKPSKRTLQRRRAAERDEAVIRVQAEAHLAAIVITGLDDRLVIAPDAANMITVR